MMPLAPNPEPEREEDAHWMAMALKEAKMAEKHGEAPIGACVVLDGQCIGTGFNQNITLCDPSAHAEIQALRAASKNQDNHRLAGATLYVTLEPCLMCLGAMLHARIERVVFGTTDQTWSISHPPLAGNSNHQLQWTPNVLDAACKKTLTAFFANKRST